MLEILFWTEISAKPLETNYYNSINILRAKNSVLPLQVAYQSPCCIIACAGLSMCTDVLVNMHTCNLVCIDGHDLFISQTGLHRTKSTSFTQTTLKTSRIVVTPTC